MKKIVMIGGAPTNGKSFIARRLAEELKLPWISTDTIREVMRKLVDKGQYRELFKFADSKVTAEDYLSTHRPKEIVESQNNESAQVWLGVEAFLDTDYVWGNFIVEGVAVIPELVSKIESNDQYVIYPVFLVDKDVNRVRKVVYTRGLWDEASTYSDDVKEVEVEWAMLFGKYIEKQCNRFGYKTYEIINREEFIVNLVEEIDRWLRES